MHTFRRDPAYLLVVKYCISFLQRFEDLTPKKCESGELVHPTAAFYFSCILYGDGIPRAQAVSIIAVCANEGTTTVSGQVLLIR